MDNTLRALSPGRLTMTAFALLLLGCGPSRVQLKPDFWKEPQRKIGIAVRQAPPLHVHPLPEVVRGSHSLDSAAFWNAQIAKTSALESHLQVIDVSRFGELADRYVEALRARGFIARRIAWTQDVERMRPFQEKSSGAVAKVVRQSLSAREDIDMLLLLALQKCGAQILPSTEEVTAMCLSGGELLDLETNQVEWRVSMEEGDGLVAADRGAWNQPPDYPALTVSLGKAVTKAQQYLWNDFFGLIEVHPMAACTDTPEFRTASAVEKRRMLRECAKAVSASSP